MEGGDAAAVRSHAAGWTTRGWSVQGRIGSDRSEARWGRLRRRTPEAYWTHPFRSSGTYWTHRFGAADGGVLDGGVLDTPFRGDVLDTPFRSSGTYWTHRFGATGGAYWTDPLGGGACWTHPLEAQPRVRVCPGRPTGRPKVSVQYDPSEGGARHRVRPPPSAARESSRPASRRRSFRLLSGTAAGRVAECGSPHSGSGCWAGQGTDSRT